ncbi:MAG TPA: hypothetical protein VN408_39460 [Actinoplanes sp.]|nr:hypothetical protein [Actinoplanes sp.]
MAHDSMISFGDDKPRRTFLRDLGQDHRVPLLVAGLSAVAAFGSLISEWQTTTLDGLGFGGETAATARVLPTDLPDLGAIGAGYLTGLLLLTVAVVLTLFGPAGGRRYAQLTGFAVGGVLLALLVTLTPHLGETSLLIPRYYTVELTGDHVRVALGRGVWCALFAVCIALVAIRLPHRDRSLVTPEPELRDEPLELTITPAAPFAAFPGERDQPHRS